MPWISGSFGLTVWSVWNATLLRRHRRVTDHRAVVLQSPPKHVGAGVGFHIGRFDRIGRDPHRNAVGDGAGVGWALPLAETVLRRLRPRVGRELIVHWTRLT